jgi:VWFA-related protein
MTTRTAAVLSLLATLAIFVSSVSAADQKPPVPTFTARSELVLVPVIARDKSGAHIAGLKKDDFSVFQNGAEQKLAVFEEVNTTKTRLRKVKLPEGEFSNMVAGPQTPTRVTIIALDGINTSIFDQLYARQAVLKYLDKAVEQDETIALIVLTGRGLKIIHTFTTDPKVLKAALSRVTGANLPGAANDMSADMQEEMDEEQTELAGFAGLADFMRQASQFQRKVTIIATMEALQQVANAFAGVPGRKSLIWASAGFPFSIDPNYPMEGRGFPRESISDVMPIYERTWQVLNDANIALYPVDVRGLVNSAFIPSSVRGPMISRNPNAGFPMRQSMAHQDTLATFNRFADMTGGKAYYNTNDLVGAFHQAAEDSSAYYMLGFYLDPKTSKAGWHKLQVKVRQADAHLRARHGFYVTAATQDASLSKKTDMAMALSSPLEFTALPFSGRWTSVVATAAAGKKRVTFELVLPPHLNLVDAANNNHLQLELDAVARTATGDAAASFGKTVDAHLKPESLQLVNNEGITYVGDLDLPPGDYSVRFVIRDDLRGRMGTVTAPIKVAQ